MRTCQTKQKTTNKKSHEPKEPSKLYNGKHQMCMCWRQQCWENIHAHNFLYGHISGRLCTDGLRKLDLWDTTGQEEYDRLRPLAYPGTDVFIVCYSVNSPSSFKNVKAKWLQEIRLHCPSTPIMMVGTNADTRNLSKEDKQSMTFVDLADAKNLCAKLGADRVMECSAKTQVGLSGVFDEIMKVGIAAKFKSKIKKRNKCVLL